MASGASDLESWFIEVGQDFLSVLFGSQAFLALSWTTPEMVLEDVVAWHRFYLAA
jgi:hypothetical protein